VKVDEVGFGLTLALAVSFDSNSDSIGSDSYNLKLSERRAESVRSYVVDRGIEAARLTARGLGESQPIADNASEEGRARNRRVLFRRTMPQP
jgi:outer membrane protein OmpA-like peptidoglycan-associated protein